MAQTRNLPKSPSVQEQLAEVYSIVDELHEVTMRLRVKMDSVIKTYDVDQPPLFPTPAHGTPVSDGDSPSDN